MTIISLGSPGIQSRRSHAALEHRLVQAIRAHLLARIDGRLADLAELLAHTRGSCLWCRHPSPSDVCGPCEASIPIYGRVLGIRTELHARMAHLSLEAQREARERAQGRVYQPRPFPGDGPTTLPRAAAPRGSSPLARIKALDLVKVAGRYTQLLPAGTGKLKGRCPFHTERTPSYYVYIDAQRWRCFGACASGGDVVDLLRGMGDLAEELRTHGARTRNPLKPRRIVNWEVRG